MNKLLKLLPLLSIAIFAFAACNEDEPERVFQPEKPSGESGNTELTDPSFFSATPGTKADLFEKIDGFTDEFDVTIDDTKWLNVDERYQSWQFRSTQTEIKDGALNLTMKTFSGNEPAFISDTQLSDAPPSDDVYRGKNGTPVFIKSGMLRSKNTIERYGYFEARIAGADLWQGSCPSFWLYTSGGNPNGEVGDISYNEIDIIEIQQVASDGRIMSCNLHTGVLNKDKKTEEKKAGKYMKMGRSEYYVDYDPWEGDYHIYGCENRPDSVVFYLDNKRVAAKPNYFWHMENKMFLTLSLGVRTPYEYYDENGKRWAVDPVGLDANLQAKVISGDVTEGSTMKIDYVRAWTRKDGYDKFRNNQRAWDENEFINQ